MDKDFHDVLNLNTMQHNSLDTVKLEIHEVQVCVRYTVNGKT